MKNRTTVERKSERELVVTRTINGPARIVFEAWTQPELLKRWWVPKSIGITLLSCELDIRVGGGYRLVFAGNPGGYMVAYDAVSGQTLWRAVLPDKGNPVLNNVTNTPVNIVTTCGV